MAMSARGRKLLNPITAKFPTLNLNGRMRPPPSVRPPPPPSGSGLDRVTISSGSFPLTPDDILRESTEYFPCYAYVDPYEPSAILNAAEDVIACAKWVIKCGKYSTGKFSKYLDVISADPVVDNLTIDTKLNVLYNVFQQFRYSRKADPIEVFLMEIYLRSMTTDDRKNYKDRHEVSCKVLSVIQSYPNVGCDYKVTEETNLYKDLSFDDVDFDRVTKALYFEFKLFLSCTLLKVWHSSCKDIIDNVYRNLRDRQLLEDFRESNASGDLYWPMPLL